MVSPFGIVWGGGGIKNPKAPNAPLLEGLELSANGAGDAERMERNREPLRVAKKPLADGEDREIQGRDSQNAAHPASQMLPRLQEAKTGAEATTLP